MNPYRELCVELPEALLEILKGVGEQAVRAAKPKKVTAYNQPWWMSSVVRSMLLDRFGFRIDRVWQNPGELVIEFCGRLACGHRVRFDVDERSMARPDHDAFDLILDAAETAERQCTCMEPQR